VITAVYILRVVGIIFFGPTKKESYLELKDAQWFEKLSGVTLIVFIAAIGFAPLWLSNLLHEPLATIFQHLKDLSL
jgi:NADH-quinone oxidoreductase subunit M